MIPRDADPLDVTPPDPLVQLREQRRRSRLGCSVALLAIVAALVVLWVGLGVFVWNVLAAPRGADQHANGGSDPFATPFRPAVGRFLGAPQQPVGLVTTTSAPASVERGAPLPAAASQPAGTLPVSVPALTYTGKLGFALPSHGSRYLAIRWPRGTVATLCGPADCVTRTSTDFGPVRSLWEAGRLADLSAVDWQRVCGVELRYGLCQGTLLIVSRPRELPETSTEVRR